MPGVKSKRTVKDESDEEEFKPEPEVKGEEAEVQGEAVKKDEDADELVSNETCGTGVQSHLPFPLVG